MQPKTAWGFGIRKLCPSGLLVKFFTAFMVWLLFGLAANAQCALTCRGKINLSLADYCEVLVTPGMLLTNGITCPNPRYRVDVLDHNKKLLPGSPYITKEFMKYTVIGMVYDSTSRNSCWTKINVEDKWGPVILCRSDTLYCNDTTIFDTPEFFDWCDTSPTLQLVGEEIETFPCDPDYLKLLTRYWTGYDKWGNQTNPICTSKILLRRIPIDSITYPKDRTAYNDCHFECGSSFLRDSNGHPHPLAAGVPTLYGHPLWPEQQFYCNTSTHYEDIVIINNSCKKKILRRWRVVEWYCGGARIRSHIQSIELLDTRPPHLHCPYDLTVTTNSGYECEAYFNMLPADVSDDCQQRVSVEMFANGVLLASSNGGYIRLPVGDNLVVFKASDDCRNEDTCRVRVRVEDKTPPVAVCDQHTVVSFTRDDILQIPAESFDDGSYDECKLDSFLVRRMDLGVPCGLRDTVYRTHVTFCCRDVGRNIRVNMRVKDKQGNTNECMVLVEVQDKTPPVIRCPHDYTIACSEHIDTSNLSYFGQPVYYDNCVVRMSERVELHLDQCHLGTINRIFVIIDNMNRRDSCTQRIHVRDTSLFGLRHITWPKDYHAFSCGGSLEPAALPDSSAYPKFSDADCSLIGVSYEDHRFNYIQDTLVCFKVLRKWKVIDWCQCYTDSLRDIKICPTWHWEQVLKIANKLPPKISQDCDTLVVCMSDTNCLGEVVRITHSASDDCTPEDDLIASFKLDIYNNGLIDSSYQIAGNQISWNGFLPMGEHRFFWIFNDRCGNQTVCSQIVVVANCKAPTAYCLNSIAVNLSAMDIDSDGKLEGMIEIWASDLDRGSYQQCGNPITFSLSRDSSDRFRRYTCDSLGMRLVQMWVTDRISGRQDFCRATIVVQDNNHVCRDSITTATVAGTLKTPYDGNINDVLVILDGGSVFRQTEANGKYSFDKLNLHQHYNVRAIKDKHYLDGITTLDIIKIQRHILGTETFDSPWKWLSADITNDQRVTTSDIAALRRLILGVDSKYSSNLSWKFLIAGYKFPVPDDPWAERLPEFYSLSSLSGNMMYLDFVGVKVGDVSQDTWGATKVQSRSNEILRLKVVVDPLKNQMHLVAAGSVQINGFQMELIIDPKEVPVREILSGKISLGAHDLYVKNKREGIYRISWTNDQPLSLHAGDILFSFSCDAVCLDHQVSALRLSDKDMPLEAYDADDRILEIQLISNDSKVFIDPPSPNPFTKLTGFKVGVEKETEIDYEIVDMHGKSLLKRTVFITSGIHNFSVQHTQLNGPGIYTLRLMVGQEVYSYRMVMM